MLVPLVLAASTHTDQHTTQAQQRQRTGLCDAIKLDFCESDTEITAAVVCNIKLDVPGTGNGYRDLETCIVCSTRCLSKQAAASKREGHIV